MLVVGATAGSAVAADDPKAEAVSAAKGLSAASLQLKVSPRLKTTTGKVTAFVELEAKPAVDTFDEKTSQGASKEQAKQAVKATKNDTSKVTDQVVGQLKSTDSSTEEVSRTSNGVPGVIVTADAAKVRELAARSDVKSVRSVVTKGRTNSNAVQLTNTIKAWQQYGKLGENVRVGIIDTGIDYTHSDFGGPGTVEAFQAIDETKVDPSYFPTAKVVGGYDFVGNGYNADSKDPAVNTPKPDPNPLGCNDHGTHVAGTAAGFGVNADGSTFTGDYTKLTPADLNAMRIGPGTAPKALLYALKVFGCEGTTNVTSAALDWALDPDGDGDFSDHLDVVNLSLGSDYGAPDDPDSLFVKKLNKKNVLTVFSAGNGGDLYDIGGSPGSTPEALTVASVRDSYVLRDGADVTAPAGVTGVKPGQYSQNYTGYPTLNLTKPVAKLTDPANLDGCLPFSAADAALVAGKYAWLEWDDVDATRRCGSAARTNNAQAAGAVGALFSSTLENFNAGIAGNATIPVFQFTGTATAALRPALNAGTLQVRLAGDLRTTVSTYDPSISDTPSSFTSRGVRGPVVKPDIAAPGDTIASALSGSGNGTLVISGTSMAAPHTSGISALVREAHPDWTTEEVKADIMNSASADVKQDGKTYAPNRVGSGRIDGKASLDNQVLAMVQDDPGNVSVSFGTVEVGGPVSLSKTIKVVNKSAKWVEYTTGYQAITSIPGVSYQLSTGSVKISPRGVAKVKVTLKIDNPAALRKTVDSTVEPLQLDVPRQFLADASGRVVLTPKSGATVPLRVPVYSAPKPVAKITTADTLNFKGKDKQAVLNLKGKGVNQGSGSQAYRSLISVLELQGTSPKLKECGKKVTENCTINETAKGGDLRYVGVASTAPLAKAQGAPEESLLAFGIATWGNWYNIGSNTIPFVDIDTTGDGVPDFETFATKLTDTDLMVATTVNLATGATVDIQGLNGQFGDVDTNIFDTNVVVLPVLLTALGLDPTKDTSRVSYQVGVAGPYVAPGTTNGLVDSIPGSFSFDPLKPGLSVQGGGDAALSYLAKPGTALVVNRDTAALAKDKADSLLVLNHHNATGDKVSVVKVRGSGGSGY
ncbi:S8 family serine peptidase [Umezawaea sp. NPDC059074]|uniref:S8 family peptidase n=1 Tax=Umezawaea sp. NPDC059074 TaxID=3346716 RepID=UPI0036794D2F